MKTMICTSCGHMTFSKAAKITIDQLSCPHCKTETMELLDEEMVPLIMEFRNKGYHTTYSCATHITYSETNNKAEYDNCGYITFAPTENGYHFNFKNEPMSYHDTSMRKLFEGLNDENPHSVTSYSGPDACAVISNDLHLVGVDGNTDLKLKRGMIEVSSNEFQYDAYDAKIIATDAWRSLYNFIHKYLIPEEEKTIWVDSEKITMCQSMPKFTNKLTFQDKFRVSGPE